MNFGKALIWFAILTMVGFTVQLLTLEFLERKMNYNKGCGCNNKGGDAPQASKSGCKCQNK